MILLSAGITDGGLYMAKKPDEKGQFLDGDESVRKSFERVNIYDLISD